jgi:mannobiose 2-epimerase
MNTHLHVLEAFVNLHRVSPTELLKVQLQELIQLFAENIISRETSHLVLFFDDEWNERSKVISYGHDIEAAWLVQEAAEVIDDQLLLKKIKDCSLALTKAASEGLDDDGGLWYEYDPGQHHLIKQKHSWPQAEAMVGFFNAWQNTGEEKYLEQSFKSWQFVKSFMHDKNCGEWYWGVNEDYSPMNTEDKVGLWKCPYHNSRACIEIINRINSLID